MITRLHYYVFRFAWSLRTIFTFHMPLTVGLSIAIYKGEAQKKGHSYSGLYRASFVEVNGSLVLLITQQYYVNSAVVICYLYSFSFM